MVTNCGGGGGGQPTVPANQDDQRGAGHSMMQGGGGDECSLIVSLYDGVIIKQSVAFPTQGERKEALASIIRAPPRVQ